MNDETRQQVLQLVTRLASKTDALKSEVAGVNDILKQLEFRVRDVEAGVDRLEAGIDHLTALVDRIDELLGPHLFPPRADGTEARLCPVCGSGRLSLKLGQFGAFIGCSNYPDCRNTRPLSVPGDAPGER